MTTRTFIFCDACNLQAIRLVELRRDPHRHGGRRLTDDRSWFEGNWTQAQKAGWHRTDLGEHVCPRCLAKLPSKTDGQLSQAAQA